MNTSSNTTKASASDSNEIPAKKWVKPEINTVDIQGGAVSRTFVIEATGTPSSSYTTPS